MSENRPLPDGDRFTLVLVLGVVVALLVVGAAGIRSYRDLALQKAREAELEGQIARTEERIAELRERVERLESDPATLERLARQELGLVRQEDLVVVFPPEEGGGDRRAE